MNRDGFTQPEVRTTDYGAQYVTASKETKIEDKAPVVLEPEKEEEPDETEVGNVLVEEPDPAPVVNEKKEKVSKPKGRPKKK